MFEEVLTTFPNTQYLLVLLGCKGCVLISLAFWGGVCEALFAHAVCPLAWSSGSMPWTSHRTARPAGQPWGAGDIFCLQLGISSKSRSSPALIASPQHLCAAGAASNQHLLRFINTLSVLGTTQHILPLQWHYLTPGNLKTLDGEPSCMPH